MSAILDIETVPQAIGYIEAAMPAELRTPTEPDPLPEKDWEAACPKYASDKDRDAKRATWVESAKARWKEDNDALKTKWHTDLETKRAAFIRDAALDARLCHIRLVGWHDSEHGATEIFAFDEDAGRVGKLSRAATLSHVIIHAFRSESAMLSAVIDRIDAQLLAEREVVTFYGNNFDIPLIYRRAWITGARRACTWKRGRYLDARFVDLYDEFTFGDRGFKTGGLDGLAAALACERRKTGDGATFGEWYDKDPGEGLAYLLNDLAVTRECAERMGIVKGAQS